jgi:hypothetical protein
VYHTSEVTYHFYGVAVTNCNCAFTLSTTTQRRNWEVKNGRLKFAAFYQGSSTLCSASTAERPKLPNHDDSSEGRNKSLKFPALSQRQLLQPRRSSLCSAIAAGQPKLPNFGFYHHPPGQWVTSHSTLVAGNTTKPHFRYITHFRFITRGTKSLKSRLNTMPKAKRY